MPKIGDSYTLTRVDEAIAVHVGRKRHEQNDNAGVEDRLRIKSERSGGEAHIDGISGEIVFHRLFKIPLGNLLRPSPRSARRNEDTEGDAKMPDGKVGDVKTRKYKYGGATCLPWKTSSGVDFFAVINGSGKRFRYSGCCTAATMKNAPIKDFGHGQQHVVEQRYLLEYEQLSWE